jgi:hypothetical protein
MLPLPALSEGKNAISMRRHSKDHERQQIIRLYREKFHEPEVNMHDVVTFAVNELNYRLPPPLSPEERAVREFSRSARAEHAYDEITKRPYRVNHALVREKDGVSMMFWIHIDQAERSQMFASLTLRREQMVGDAMGLVYDADRWNRMHPREEAIQMELDLKPDVEWRMNYPDDEEEAS